MIKIIPLTTHDELFCKYSSQQQQQDCYMELDLQDETVQLSYNGEIGNSIPSSVYHNRTLRFSVECLTMDKGNALLVEALPICQRISAGYEIEWTGNNHKGRTTTYDARNAIDELHKLCAGYAGNSPENILVAQDVGEWFVDGGDIALKWCNLNVDSSDADVKAAAENEVNDAMSAGAVMASSEVVNYLTEAREEAREEIRWELAAVAEQVLQAVETRNRLITRQLEWGSSTRSIADLTGLSHVAIHKIGKRMRNQS